jgi:cytochrome c oxidase subunit 2
MMGVIATLSEQLRRRRVALLAAVVALLATSCATNRQDMFEPTGTDAKDIDVLLRASGYISIVVGVLVGVAVVAIVVRFRRTARRGDDLPAQIHGNTRLEIGWTIAPALLLASLAVPTVQNVIELNTREDDGMEVIVQGQQWWWQFQYDVDDDGTTDITTANEIVIPVDRAVNLDIRAADVIHSFWIPSLNGKRDAVPGRQHFWKLRPTETGVYWGACTEYCGLAHADMRIRAIVLEQADFDRWVEEQLQPAEVPPEGDSIERRGYEVFTGNCVSCHVVRGDEATESALDQSQVPLRSGVAPDLTHLMSRTSFAGALFPMYIDDDRVNVPDLRAWVHDAPSVKPMDPDNQQGMISFAETLTEDDLDAVIAYLRTLGPEPVLPEGITPAEASLAP